VIARLAQNDHSIKLLMTLPGVSLMTAACLVGAIGEVARFRDAGSSGGLFRSCASVKQSAPITCYYGSITKVGNNQVRKNAGTAARDLRTHPGPLGAYFRRMAKHKHINVAANCHREENGDGGISDSEERGAVPLCSAGHYESEVRTVTHACHTEQAGSRAGGSSAGVNGPAGRVPTGRTVVGSGSVRDGLHRFAGRRYPKASRW